MVTDSQNPGLQETKAEGFPASVGEAAGHCKLASQILSANT